MGELDRQIEDVSDLLRERLGIGGADLADQLRRTGRLLPKARRADGRVLADAHHALSHPRLSRQTDIAAATEAAKRLAEHLRGIDPKERRRTRTIGILAVIGFNLLILLGLTLIVLAWRGFL